MIIGNFQLVRADSYSGDIRTLTLDLPRVTIRPVEEKREKGPDYIIRIHPDEGRALAHEIGAAWKRTRKLGGAYLSVKLDSPELPAPIHAALVSPTEEDTDMTLVWTRNDQKA